MTQVSLTGSPQVPPEVGAWPNLTPSAALTEKELGHWKLLQRFRELVEQALRHHPSQGSWTDPRRRLHQADYLSLFLFGLLNPVVQTLRGFSEATRLQRVQAEVCPSRVARATFSDAQHVLDPALLERVFSDLSAGMPQQSAPQSMGSWQWMARDGSLFRALPRMTWALYGAGRPRSDGEPSRAVRLHLSLHLLDDKPVQVAVRPGRQCERAVWEEQLEAGAGYVGDRYFGENYQLFDRLTKKGCAFVLRLMDTAVVHVEEELPLTEQDRAANVVRQAWACLGHHARQRSVRVRLVWIQTLEGQILLATNLAPAALSAALVGELYRKRWLIEMFFRWVKCVLGCGHWFAESQAGVTIQIYLALIAGLLLQLYTGRRPTQRMMELVRMYLMGWASEKELETGLNRYRQELDKRKKS